MTLPPGQHAIDGFPRFGTHFHEPPPAVPAAPAIAIGGAVAEPLSVPLPDLSKLPRRELHSDFHCVSGWSATGLRWEGVPFADFYREAIEPAVAPGTSITHLVFEGLDGYRTPVVLDDALADDVLIAENLDGRPLNGDHGAPVRLVSPSQYGYMSTKHLCRIEVHTAQPGGRYVRDRLRQFGLQLVKPHRRARVWEEERHQHLPAWVVRPVYRRLVKPIKMLSARGSRS